MSIAFDHRDEGTPEPAWQAAAPWVGAPALSLDVDRVVVVAAHPDDETLGAGGLIASASRAGLPVSVLVLTDGEGSHPGDDGIAALRRSETLAAVGVLCSAAEMQFAGLPDGGLREHRTAVRDAIAGVLGDAETRRTLLAVPWWGDGHRDHRIVGEAALSLQRPDAVVVVGYPIWMWHWSAAESVDANDWHALALPTDVVAAKRRAIAAHVSQLEPSPTGAPPILHPGMRAHFERDREVFIAAPPTPAHRVHSPEWFESFFRRHPDPWGFESRWYEHRKRALLLACLPRERYAHAVELGCATGLLTAQLAERADRVTAADVADTALARARERVADPHVSFVRADLPREWPSGSADLVVLSEVGYYWSAPELATALSRIAETLEPGGELVACHWRPPIDGCELTGDDVHAAIDAHGSFHRTVSHREESFVLDVFARGPRPETPPEAT